MKKSREPYSFESWCQKELSRLLKFQVGDDLITYLLSMETEKDIREYIQDLLGNGTKQANDFQREFFKFWHPPGRVPSPYSCEDDVIMQELVRANEEDMVLYTEKSEHSKVRLLCRVLVLLMFYSLMHICILTHTHIIIIMLSFHYHNNYACNQLTTPTYACM